MTKPKGVERMSEEKILDIAHVSFLDMIGALVAQAGPAAAKGTLMRTALSAGSKMKAVKFKTFEDFIEAIDAVETPIAAIEGRAEHVGDGVFGLPTCPFASSIGNYKKVFESMPDGYAELTVEFNKPGKMADKLRVGRGAGVSPFCSVHQPLRSSLGDKITIGGKPVAVYQLGCKSGTGSKGLAHDLIEEVGASPDLVEKVLVDHMCCYAVKVEQ